MEWRKIVSRHESVALNRHQSSDVRELAQETVDIINLLRNELCIKCGRYNQAHNGACDGCNWK